MKFFGKFRYRAVTIVAPHAGAWVEIVAPLPKLTLAFVAPHAGAWVEIGYPYL